MQNKTYSITDEDFQIDEASYSHLEKWFDENEVLIDPYNADLNMKLISDDHLTAEPLSQDGFSFMLASCRATHGFKSGKIAFQLKVLNVIDVSNQKFEETHTPELRVGFSTCQPPSCQHMRLGESPCSYAYCNNGRKARNGQFVKYAASYGEPGDVVTVLLDLETGSGMEISFALNNGVPFEAAYRLTDHWDCSAPLYPHVTAKNVRFRVNFGQCVNMAEHWPTLPDGYTFVNNVPSHEKYRHKPPPNSKQDCTVICMIGLPGSGKTAWVQSFLNERPFDETWCVLSSSTVLDQMKVQGTVRKKLYQGRWDMMMGAVVKCLNRFILLACRMRRNYLLDMTNCYSLPRRKKMTPFVGFKRLAYVIVPSLEDYANRCQQQMMVEGKQMPSDAILEMKACFCLPKEDELDVFDQVFFVELQRDEAQKVVEYFNEEGRAFKPREKKRRGDWHQEDLPPEVLKKYKKPAGAPALGVGGTSSSCSTSNATSIMSTFLANSIAAGVPIGPMTLSGGNQSATSVSTPDQMPSTVSQTVGGATDKATNQQDQKVTVSSTPVIITNRPMTNERPAWLAGGAAALTSSKVQTISVIEANNTPHFAPSATGRSTATTGSFTPRAGWPASWPQALWRGTSVTPSTTPGPPSTPTTTILQFPSPPM